MLCLFSAIGLAPEIKVMYVCMYMEPHFGGRGGRRGSAMAPLERAVVVSYRLSILTVVLCVTFRPQFAIE